ncbi:putative ripening-related protein 6 [Setaria viridis]|uniref:RlpA-like protein double-psi beta-barrel domain-containing protein n=1 Tax=Setaria viridis TaxID=4556 RepID=A0A4U6SY29_SETVI|nr:putative ripening-related protein 6 [Setaria viridis]TKV93194.1 hypothetical protein SEVIR_9G210200v2 [Setaria viridis]
MANARVVALFAVFALLQITCTVARRHGKPGGYHHEGTLASSRDGNPAVLTVNGFQRGEEGGPSECDGHFHSDGDLIVALSTGWFAGGHRCHRAIRITSARTGRSVEARVVDECDSRRGCRDNVVDSSAAVWKALGLDTDAGEVPVTWSDA